MRWDAIGKTAMPLVVCAMLNGAAYFQAKGISSLIAGVMVKDSPVAPRHVELPPRLAREIARSAEVILERNAFDSVTGPLVGDRARTPAKVESDLSCNGVRASLIAFGDDPNWSFASLSSADTPPLLRRIGDEVAGRTVVAIRRDRVVLGAGKGTCEVKLGVAATTDAKPAKSAARDPLSASVERVGEDAFVVDKRAVTALLSDPHALLGRVRVRPDAGGLRVLGVKDDGPLASLGLRDGDVLMSVGGTPLSDPSQSVAALMHAAQSDHVDVVVERAGKSRTVKLTLR